jgi:hypothetical protein
MAARSITAQSICGAFLCSTSKMTISMLLVPQLVCLAQTSAPLISFEKMHHDFNKVSEGTKVSYEFKVTNR